MRLKASIFIKNYIIYFNKLYYSFSITNNLDS